MVKYYKELSERAAKIFIVVLLVLLYSGWAQADKYAYIEDNNKAIRMLKNGKHQEGISLLKHLLEEFPHEELLRKNLRNAYLSAGMALLNKRDYQKLSELMLEAQNFDDNERLYWVMRGQALHFLKKYDGAEVDLQMARNMGEPEAHILLMLGNIFYATDRLNDAFDVLGTARMLDSNNHAINQMYEKVKKELAVEQSMDKEYGRHFIITFDGKENKILGQDILNTLEDIYFHLGSLLDYYPEQQTPIILYTRKQFKELTRSPDWSGGVYDGKIRLPIGGIDTVDDKVHRLLAHEYMHVILREIAGSNIPCWLNEGLAQLAEFEKEERPLVLFEKLKRKGKLFKLASLEGTFKNYSGMHAMLAYDQSQYHRRSRWLD